MRTGDQSSAREMAYMLIREAGKRGVPIDGVSAQICKEYGITIPLSSIPPGESFSEEYVEAAFKRIEKTQARISELILINDGKELIVNRGSRTGDQRICEEWLAVKCTWVCCKSCILN